MGISPWCPCPLATWAFTLDGNDKNLVTHLYCRGCVSAEFEYTTCTMVNPAQAIYNCPVIVVPINASYIYIYIYIYPYVGACRNKVNCCRKSLPKSYNAWVSSAYRGPGSEAVTQKKLCIICMNCRDGRITVEYTLNAQDCVSAGCEL